MGSVTTSFAPSAHAKRAYGHMLLNGVPSMTRLPPSTSVALAPLAHVTAPPVVLVLPVLSARIVVVPAPKSKNRAGAVPDIELLANRNSTSELVNTNSPVMSVNLTLVKLTGFAQK